MLFQNTFYGTRGDTWQDFNFVTGNPSFTLPVVDGYGHGMASQAATLLWRARSAFFPGRADYVATLTARWKNPAGATRACGLLVRFKDWDNFLSLRLSSTVGGAPVLQLILCTGGVETSLGTYGGVGVSSLLGGLAWNCKVEDKADGTTDVSAVIADLSVITWNGDIGILRGSWTAGVELGSNCQGDDILIGPLFVDEVVEEFAPLPPSSDSRVGWFVTIGSVRYSLKQLRSVGVDLQEVVQAYGQSGGTCSLTIQGNFVESSYLYPGQLVKVHQDGYCRFAGYVSGNERSATPQEGQIVSCRDALWQSRQVWLRNDDLTGTHFFNVYDTKSEYYNPEWSDMTIGDIIKWLFDRYSEELAFYGAGGGYVLDELADMDVVIPDLTVRGTFIAAILSLLKFAPEHDLFVYPGDGVWHFKDVTKLSEDSIVLTEEHSHLNISPSREDSYTAVEIIGGIRQDAPPEYLKLSDGSLQKAWTDEQEENYTKDKAGLGQLVTKILATGTVTDPNSIYWERDYIDIPAADAPDNDDFRGAVTLLQGLPRLVISNQGARFYLSSPNWNTPPSNGDPIVFSLMDEGSLAMLSAAGVGRGFIAPALAHICPTVNKYSALKNGGWCGDAIVKTRGPNGVDYSQNYEYSIQYDNLQAMGCSPVVQLAAKSKPPIGLSNRLPPGGSWDSSRKPDPLLLGPTIPQCQPGELEFKQHTVDVQINVSRFAEQAAYIREPNQGYHGPAYSEEKTNWDGGGSPNPGDWGVRQRLVLNIAEFVDESIQGPGLRLYAQALLNLFSQKQYTFDVTLVTPWTSMSPTRPGLSSSGRFANLTKRITVSSLKRVTGFEAAENLPVHRVRWRIKDQQTILTAGTVAGWKSPDAAAIQRVYLDKNILEKTALMIQHLETFRNSLISKEANRVAPSPLGSVDGCDVTVINDHSRRVTNVEYDEKNKNSWLNHLAIKGKASEVIDSGANASHPGTDPVAPGFATDLIHEGDVLRPAVPFDIPSSAPDGDIFNDNRGRYGGYEIQDESAAGYPPAEIFKRGNVLFRVSGSDSLAGTGIEFSPLDGEGNPTAWLPYETNRDLWDAGINPRNALNSRGILHDHETHISDLMSAVGRLESDEGTIVFPGEVTPETPDGAPSDLWSLLTSDAFAKYFEVIARTDPGGLVFDGPKTESGADAERLWRVHPELATLLRVMEVAPGTGTNGGNYAWASVANGSGVDEFISSGRVIHKQVHATELQESRLTPGTTYYDVPISEHGFDDNISVKSGGIVGANFPLPNGAVGRPLISGIMVEKIHQDPSIPYTFDIHIQYKASPYSTPQAVYQASTTPDGTGQTTGRFMGPADQVPPGLRTPFGAVMNVGIGNPGSKPIGLGGIGVDIAVVEGGFLLRIKNEVSVTDSVSNLQGTIVEKVFCSDRVLFSVGRTISDSIRITESVSIELNPPLGVQELVIMTEEVVLS